MYNVYTYTCTWTENAKERKDLRKMYTYKVILK